MEEKQKQIDTLIAFVAMLKDEGPHAAAQSFTYRPDARNLPMGVQEQLKPLFTANVAMDEAIGEACLDLGLSYSRLMESTQ